MSQEHLSMKDRREQAGLNEAERIRVLVLLQVVFNDYPEQDRELLVQLAAYMEEVKQDDNVDYRKYARIIIRLIHNYAYKKGSEEG